jgi:hypothetical protein
MILFCILYIFLFHYSKKKVILGLITYTDCLDAISSLGFDFVIIKKGPKNTTIVFCDLVTDIPT